MMMVETSRPALGQNINRKRCKVDRKGSVIDGRRMDLAKNHRKLPFSGGLSRSLAEIDGRGA
uniref:Uncharacterized protein n=1 Tax=Solanum tuberosum TaxID=4113 RepID=M1BR15_SOLTU